MKFVSIIFGNNNDLIIKFLNFSIIINFELSPLNTIEIRDPKSAIPRNFDYIVIKQNMENSSFKNC